MHSFAFLFRQSSHAHVSEASHVPSLSHPAGSSKHPAVSKWHSCADSFEKHVSSPLSNPNDAHVFPSRFMLSHVSPVCMTSSPHVAAPSVHPVMKQSVQLMLPFKVSMLLQSCISGGSVKPSHSSPASSIPLPQMLHASLHVPSGHSCLPEHAHNPKAESHTAPFIQSSSLP